MNHYQSVLGFDFGTEHIGVAVGQALTGTATPLAPLPARDGIPNWDTIGQLIEQWRPQALVVGIPLNMDDTPSDMSKRAQKFCNRLQGRFNLPSFGMDERLSTFEAKAEAREQQLDSYVGGGKGRGRKASHKNKSISIDSLAAKLIVESWLRTQADAD